ncbi:MAG: hypothetical protein C4337_08190 [Armatimonadota bacterium]
MSYAELGGDWGVFARSVSVLRRFHVPAGQAPMAMIQNGKRTDADSPTELDRDIAPVSPPPLSGGVSAGRATLCKRRYYTPLLTPPVNP